MALFLLFFFLILQPCSGGTWSIKMQSIGISAMHMQLLPNDRVVIFDRTNFGKSNISLPIGKCPNKTDCTAHSVEYNVASNNVRPLTIVTNVWCSSGSLSPGGRLVQTGGDKLGAHVVRVFNSCDTCDWVEIPNGLNQKRWYATNHILPDGSQIIIGGRNVFNYEFFPKSSAAHRTSVPFPFLNQTRDIKEENNLYPFVFLCPDGNLFVFANSHSVLLDYKKNKIIKTYPAIPDGHPRNYPCTGSAVLLPLQIKGGRVKEVEVLICGGAPRGAFLNAQYKKKFDTALDTCWRIKISDPNPQWVMETMPLARVMGDMVMLPNGHILIINGGSKGSAGWELGRNPVLSPVEYRPKNPHGSRFKVESPSNTPRMYHSTAILLRDGRILVGGSNPHRFYKFKGALYPTELSLETFSPSYLDYDSPPVILPLGNTKLKYNDQFVIHFMVSGIVDIASIKITLVAPSFNTHSFSMNQRLLILDDEGIPPKIVGRSTYRVLVRAPPTGNIAPSGRYMLFVIHKDIPSQGAWVEINDMSGPTTQDST